ncbi:MAG: diguanylate cyclase [Nitrosomonadales bacterium]|nr:diguanylate cyclase [Nitrosomonadales bacterium]
MFNRKYGIREHVSLLTLLPLMLFSIAMSMAFIHEQSDDMDEGIVSSARLIARQLAANSEYAIFSHNQSFLQNIAASALQEPDVRAVLITDQGGNVIALAGKLPASILHSLADRNTQAVHRSDPPVRGLLVLANRSTPIFDDGNSMLAYQPILSTQIALDNLENEAEAQQIGAVIIALSREQVNQRKQQLLLATLLSIVTFLILTLYVIYRASRKITHPIRQLSIAIQSIGSGHLDTRISQQSGISELCTLTEGVNQMAAQLQQERTLLQHRIDEATEQLRNMAFYDTLTLLPNRRLLNDRLAQALSNSRRSGHYGAVMFIDLDNFKPLNDQFGHAVGDLLLIEAAHRISSCLRETDTVARFGGDEFVVMLSELNADHALSFDQAFTVAEKIRTTLAKTYHLIHQPQGQPEARIEHHCTSSIGIVLFQSHDTNPEHVLSMADMAMYQAKESGRNLIRFHPKDTEEL